VLLAAGVKHFHCGPCDRRSYDLYLAMALWGQFWILRPLADVSAISGHTFLRAPMSRSSGAQDSKGVFLFSVVVVVVVKRAKVPYFSRKSPKNAKRTLHHHHHHEPSQFSSELYFRGGSW